MLCDIASHCPGFKYSKEEVRSVLKDIAEFRAPGIYVLSEYQQKRELPALQQQYEGVAKASEHKFGPPHICTFTILRYMKSCKIMGVNDLTVKGNRSQQTAFDVRNWGIAYRSVQLDILSNLMSALLACWVL